MHHRPSKPLKAACHFQLALQEELVRRGCPAEKIAVWRRAVDTAAFNPAHRSAAMRARLTGGDPDAPPGSVLLFVGRLGPGEVSLACMPLMLA